MKSLHRIVVLIVITLSVLAHRASAQYAWQRAIAGSFQGIAFNPLSHGEIIYAASYDSIGIYRSDDHGRTWSQYTAGLEPFSTSNIHQILCVPSDTSVVLAVSPSKLYRSTDGAKTWAEIPDLGGIEGEDVDYQGATDALYYGQNFKGPTWKSTDHGANWTMTGAASDSVGLCTIAASPDVPVVLLAGSEGGEIARSTQEGANWHIQLGKDTGNFEPEVPKIVYSRWALTTSGIHGVAYCTRWPSQGNAIVKTTDNGVSWTSLHHPSRNPWAIEIDQRQPMLMSPGDAGYPGPLHLWMGLFHDRSDTATNGLVQESNDGGITWHSAGFPAGVDGDPVTPMTRDVWVLKFDTTSGRLIASTSTGVWIAETKAGVGENVGSPRLAIAIDGTKASLTTSEAYTIEAFSVLGARLLQSQSSPLDLSQLPHGAYFLRARTRSGEAHRAIVR